MKDIQFSFHAESVALRVSGKSRADSWSAYSWRLNRVGCEVGIAEHRILTRGPNKGRRHWPKSGPVVVVTTEEVHTEAERYEREEKRCACCLGEKREPARCDQETHTLRIRLAESRALLTRMVKYAREDKARTNGATRLARLVDQVADYLTRTHDPMSILREDP